MVELVQRGEAYFFWQSFEVHLYGGEESISRIEGLLLTFDSPVGRVIKALQNVIHSQDILSEITVLFDQIPTHLRPLSALATEDHGELWNAPGDFDRWRDISDAAVRNNGECPMW